MHRKSMDSQQVSLVMEHKHTSAVQGKKFQILSRFFYVNPKNAHQSRWVDEYLPGRVVINGTNLGILVTYGSERRLTDDLEYLTVPHDCQCQWMAPAVGDLYDELVFSNDPTSNYVVGRKNISATQVAIAKVRYPSFAQLYTNVNNVEVSEAVAQEVLVCTENAGFVQPPVFDYAAGSCGVWTPYTYESQPELDGVIAGISRTNNVAYVGRGWNSGQYLPGTLQLAGPNTKTIVSITNEVALQWPQYLVEPSNCSCQWLPAFKAVKQPGVVVIPDPNYHFYVGRKNFTNGQISISKVERSNLKQWYINQNGVEANEAATEILVCSNTTPLPKSCGEIKKIYLKKFNFENFNLKFKKLNFSVYWSRYANLDNGPTINGFSAGTARDGTPAYIGRAWNGGEYIPGRVVTSGTNVGIFVDNGGEKRQTDDLEYLTLPQGCQCQFMPPAAADTYDELVHTSDPTRNYVVGRVNITATTMTVAKVAYPNFNQYWADASNTDRFAAMAAEVLVCTRTSGFTSPPTFNPVAGMCGVWTPYTYESTPEIDGVVSGLSRTNNTAYVARGLIITNYTIFNFTLKHDLSHRLQRRPVHDRNPSAHGHPGQDRHLVPE
jgi:hypothetical protein